MRPLLNSWEGGLQWRRQDNGFSWNLGPDSLGFRSGKKHRQMGKALTTAPQCHVPGKPSHWHHQLSGCALAKTHLSILKSRSQAFSLLCLSTVLVNRGSQLPVGRNKAARVQSCRKFPQRCPEGRLCSTPHPTPCTELSVCMH